MRPTSSACSWACLAALVVSSPVLAAPGPLAVLVERAPFQSPAKAQDKAPDQQAPRPEADIAAARTALIARLVEFAGWCAKVELFEERDKVWAEILVLDPKNLDAHKGLGHARSTDGTWRETKRHAPKNRSTKSLPEVPRKRAEAMKPFADAMLARAQAATDPALRRLYIDAIVAVDPDDPTLHAFQGDVQDGERWVLPETVSARERRARIKTLVKSTLDAAPEVKPEPPLETDPKPTFAWKPGITTGSVRVFTTGAEEDARQLARTCTAAGQVAQSLFGSNLLFPPRFTFYLLDPTQKDALLATLNVEDAERARLAKLEGTGLPRRQDVALWNGNKARMLDASVRHTLSYLFARGFGLTPACGWVWEGFGLYLTRELVGTRLTWFVASDGQAASAASATLRARLLAQDANWMNEALTLFGSDKAPNLADVMKRNLGQMDVTDVVASYALTAYLIESRPEQAIEIARRSAAGEDPDVITRSTLSLSTQELRDRLVRWLSERK